MALCCSQILFFSPSTVTKSPNSRSFITLINRLHRRSPATPNHLVRILTTSISIARAASSPGEYVYPAPDPEFAEAEVVKFRGEILKKLAKEKEEFGDSLNEVVNVCEQELKKFLQNEYGGPGTFIVEPFTYIMVSLKEKSLPGAPLAARTSLLWAQKHLDDDWKVWFSSRNQ